MLLIISYLLALGAGPLVSSTPLFSLNLFYLFKLKRIYFDINLIIISIIGLLISFFLTQSMDQFITSFAVILISIVLCNYILTVPSKTVHTLYRIISFLFIILYLISYSVVGNRELVGDLIGIGTYNAHYFIMLMLFTMHLIKTENVKSFDVLIFVFSGLILGGRTNIIIALLFPLFYLYRKNNLAIIILTISMFFMNAIIVEYFTEYLGGYFLDYKEKGFRLGPREVLYSCIYTKLNFYDLIIGFDIKNTLKLCFVEVIGEKTESSFIQLFAHWGIGGLFLLIYIFNAWFRNKLLWLLMLLMFRGFSGDFFFFGIYDWILILPIFLSSNKIKNDLKYIEI